MKLISNHYRNSRDKVAVPDEIPLPSTAAEKPTGLLSSCPVYHQAPLLELASLADDAGVGRLFLKDETERMGLGSFKALGAAYVIAHEAVATGKDDLSSALTGRTFVTASAGNHGLSVAAGATVFGANSVIYLAETVPEAFADRLRAKGAEVRVEGAEYEASMQAAQNAAEEEGFTLLSDSSWDGYFELPHRLMEGYLASAKETVDEMPVVPSHIFLQAGVGGLAGAMAAYFRSAWGDEPIIVVVEPEKAPALQASIEAGKPVYAEGAVSNMRRLDCKEPSFIALKGLADDADFFLTVSDELASEVTTKLERHDIHSTPSGVGGLSGLFAGEVTSDLKLDEKSVCLCIISEGAE